MRITHAIERLAQHANLAGSGPYQADHRSHQNRFAGAGAADDTHHLAAAHFEIQPVMDDVSAELGTQAGDANNGLAAGRRH